MDEFPNELLLQIFSLLHTPITCFSAPRVPAPSRDLLALCRVCRSFRDVARSLIYESIERDGDMNSEAFRQLPRTLLENVELCGYIKNLRLKMEDGFEVGDFWAGHNLRPENELDDEEVEERATQDARCIRYQRRHQKMLDGNGSDVDEEVSDIPDYTPEGYEWLGELISAMDSSQAHASDHDLLERAILGEDVLLTPCILAACNLERLWIRLPKTQLDGNNTSFLLNSIVHSAHEGGFERLKVLHLDIHQSDLEWPVRDVLPFFLLPSLTDLTLGNCGETDHGRPWAVGPDTDDSAFMGDPWKWPVRSSSIARLSLLSPRFSGSIAAKMIVACRAITDFEVVSPYERRPRDYEFYDDVRTALIQHANTLVSLSLGDTLGVYWRTFDSSPGTFRMSSFFSSLTFLRAKPYLLLGYDGLSQNPPSTLLTEISPVLADTLPDTLEHLWLDAPCRPWYMNLLPYCRGLFKAVRSGQFSQLKSIYVHWHLSMLHQCPNPRAMSDHVRTLTSIRDEASLLAEPIAVEFTVRIAYTTPGKSRLFIVL